MANAALRRSMGSLRRMILPIERHEIECVQKHACVIAPITNAVEDGEPLVITGDRFTVDQKRFRFDRIGRFQHKRKPSRPVETVARDDTDTRRVAADHHAEAVVLNLMQPAGTGGRLHGPGWQTGLDPGRLGLFEAAAKLTQLRHGLNIVCDKKKWRHRESVVHVSAVQ